VALLPVLGGVGASLYVLNRETPRPARSAGPAVAPVAATYVGVATSNLNSFAKAIGRRPNLAVRYFNWGSVPPASFVEESAAAGAESLLELEPRDISLRSIIGGAGDGYLKRVGKDLAATHSQVMLSFAPEMDGPWYRWGFGRRSHRSASVFRRAWRHVYGVLTKIAGTRITWVWQISHEFPYSGALKPLWPGRRYVSLIGIDGYYLQRPDTFDGLFGKTIKDVRKFTTTPILIAETAVGQLAGRAAKIPGLFEGMRRFGLRGIVWFDHNQHSGIHHQRWSLEGHPAEIAAFRKGLRLWLRAAK
jgi:hypothetical protein